MSGYTHADTLTLEGNYQGRNLYVQNPVDGEGFCTKLVLINGKPARVIIESSAYEIKLDTSGYKYGDKLVVKIVHSSMCKPRILNPEPITPRATFQIKKIMLEGDVLKWTTIEENGKLPFNVEQYRWNKWVKVGEVEGKGSLGENNYEFKVPIHAGENRFRIRQNFPTNTPRISKTVTFTSTKEPVQLLNKKMNPDLSFSSETMYEVHDEGGELMKKGSGKHVSCGDLKKGMYYLSYDNFTVEVVKE